MSPAPIEIYQPRHVSDVGNWQVSGHHFKIYGLTATGQTVSTAICATAKHFVETDVQPEIVRMGDSNNTGFVIIHPGALGLSISAHWWVQGSVLCQAFFRQLYDEDTPIDHTSRPVIGCVWELAIINAEQQAWRRDMMQAKPDLSAYLASRPNFDTV